MKKKGQGISLETIIVAAIVLVVLVVLWAIFTGRLSLFSKGLDDQTKGPVCEKKTFGLDTIATADVKPVAYSCPKDYRTEAGVFSNVKANEVCCVKSS